MELRPRESEEAKEEALLVVCRDYVKLGKYKTIEECMEKLEKTFKEMGATWSDI